MKASRISTPAVLEDNGSVNVFCVNRDMKDDYTFEIDLRSFGKMKLAEHILLHNDDVKAVNTETAPDTVSPSSGPGGEITDGKASLRIPALSWNVIRFEKQAD